MKTDSKSIRFFYDLRGADCELEVIKRQGGSKWLCKVISGPLIGEEFLFEWETIRFGQLVLAARQKQMAMTAGGVGH